MKLADFFFVIYTPLAYAAGVLGLTAYRQSDRVLAIAFKVK